MFKKQNIATVNTNTCNMTGHTNVHTGMIVAFLHGFGMSKIVALLIPAVIPK